MRTLWFPLTILLIVGLWAYTRFWPSPAPESDPTMPTKVDDVDVRDLYLMPGGGYTEADITANRGMTSSLKYPNFRANHDANPQPGDQLCPITRTKANPRCVWVIGGREYQFCCPPCIDELVRLAKTDPNRVRPPAEYAQPVGR